MKPLTTKRVSAGALFALSLLLGFSLVFPLSNCSIREAAAATLHRGDVTRAQSEGIVLDANLYAKEPSFDKDMGTTLTPSKTTTDTIHTYCYGLRVPANTYQPLGTTINARWDDVGFDADDDRIDLVLSWLPDSRWYAKKALTNIPLLQRYDQNGFGSAGICIGLDSNDLGSKACCEQHIKISFYKHGSTTPASGSFLTKITDLDTKGWDEGYGDRWCESIEFLTGHSPDMYIPDSNILNIGSNRRNEDMTDYRATRKMEGSSLDSGVVARLSHGAEFWYYSSYGWTDILDQFDPKNIALSSTSGGTAHCRNQTDSVAVGWRGNRTISIEPNTGYLIEDVLVDGASIGACSSYAFNDVVADHVLNAVFAPLSYSIRFDPNGAQGSMVNQELSFDTSQRLTANAFSRTGYAFTGWNSKADGSGTSYQNEQEVCNLSTINGEIIDLFAQWEPASYQLSFEANGGAGTMEDQRFVYDQPQKIAFNQFERKGYLFSGWNTRADGSGTSYTNEQEVMNLTTENGQTITLYAQWEPVNYFIAFDANGGAGAMFDQRLTFDQPSTLQELSFTRTGFRWISWDTHPSVPERRYEDQALVENLAKRANEVITLYAIWSANRYLIVYDSNGGCGTMHAQSLAYGSAESLYPNAFQREGYHWIGWNTRPDGSGTLFDDKQSVQDLSTIDNSTIILYALWEKDQPDSSSDPDTNNSDASTPGPGAVEPDLGTTEPDPDINDEEPDFPESDLGEIDSASSITEENAEGESSPFVSEEADSADPLNDPRAASESKDQDDTRDLADPQDSLASFAKTGESIMPALCLVLVLFSGGIAFLVEGKRRRKRLQDRKRQLFRNFLEP